MQNDFISDIQILDMVIDERMRGLEDIERQYPQQKISRTELEQYKAEKKRFIETNDKKCQQQYESFKALVADVCKAQPPLEALSDSAINATNAFPSALSFGRLRISHDLFKNGRTFVPRILAFPLSRALWFPSKKDSLIQNSFVGEVKNWVDFNARHQDNPLFYKVIILVSIPEQLTDKNMVYLERLLIHGPSCGMLPILLVDEEKCTTSKISKYEDLFKKITDKAVRMNELCPLSFKHLQIEEEKEQLPEDEEARQRGFVSGTKIFRGADLPAVPKTIVFEQTEELILELGVELSYEASPLRIHIPNKTGGNLLVVGSGERLQGGLLSATLKSAVSQVDEILVFGMPNRDFSDIKKIQLCSDVQSLNLPKILEEIGKTRRLLIINGLEDVKELRLSTSKGATQTQAELFKSILEEGPSAGTFTIVFSKNWTRFTTFYKDTLSSFELRIAYNLDETKAGSVIGITAGGIKGLDKENRALFADRLKNVQQKFMPYREKES